MLNGESTRRLEAPPGPVYGARETDKEAVEGVKRSLVDAGMSPSESEYAQ